MYDSSAFAIMGGFFIILVIVGIALYIVMALALQAMAKKLDLENTWLAWIPVANVYLMGKIAGDEVTIFQKKIPKLSLVLLVGAIATVIISSIPVIGQLVCIAYAVLSFVAMYKVYRIFAEGSAVLFIVLSIVINITAPFLMLAVSKNEPNMTIFNEGKDGGYTGYTAYTAPAQQAATVTPYIEEPIAATTVEPAVETTAEPVVEAAPEPVAEAADAPAPADTDGDE
jgi:hypothetical protein